jgi:rod shape-determining protein MreD
MLHRLGLLLLIYAGAVLETAGAPGAATAGVRICWLYLAAVSGLWCCSASEAAAWGAIVGLVCDAIGAGALGVEFGAVCLVAWCAARLRTRWNCTSLLALGLFSMSTVGVLLLATGVSQALQAGQSIPRDRLGTVAAGGAAATGLVALFAAAVWRTVHFSVQQFLRAQRALA